MSAKEKARERAAKVQPGATTPAEKEPEMDDGTDLEAYEPASARSMPRPHTSLAAGVKKDIGNLTVSLLGDVGSAPSLAAVEKFNKRGEGESRTPLMTVVQAVLAKAGGSMKLGELAAQTRKCWERPFPAGPYSDEEIVYLLVRNSDSVRVS
ncbi:MAG: hypothetical protein ACLP5H_32460 [Desulfomonilaceae bacterium]